MKKDSSNIKGTIDSMLFNENLFDFWTPEKKKVISFSCHETENYFFLEPEMAVADSFKV